MEEMVDIVDEKTGEPTGKIISKDEAHLKGIWHVAAHVWIINSNGEVLLQKRSVKKKLHPGLWDVSAAGHVPAGESIEDAAIREVKEEIGLKIKKSDLKKVFVERKTTRTGYSIRNREFYHVFLMRNDTPISKMKMQKEEVDELKFIPLEQFAKEIFEPEKYNHYVNHGKYYSKIINSMKKEMKH
jgi:isopentenyldiphosphate isomerase